jgi:hypothetical protein
MYTCSMPAARTCLVSFTDSESIRQTAEVTECTLYEAAVMEITQFRSSGFKADASGPATRLTVAQVAQHDPRSAVGQGRDMASERGETE